MIANECIILILLMVYSAIGLGTILRIEEKTSIFQKIFIFFCMPLIAVLLFFAWIGLYISSKNVKNKRIMGIFHFFTILPEICEGIVYDIFNFSLDDDNNIDVQNEISNENNDAIIEEDTRIVSLHRRKNRVSTTNYSDDDLYEETYFANTKIRKV